MSRFPGVRRIASAIATSKVTKNTTVGDSVGFLASRHAEIKDLESLDDLSEAVDTGVASSGLLYHFSIVRAEVGRRLWEHQIFIGLTALDQLLFREFKSASSDPVRTTLESIRDLGLHRPGLVIYPLHSLGFLGLGFTGFTRVTARMHLDGLSMVLAPQASYREDVMGFLSDACATLNIGSALDEELIRHWMRSRPIQWLHRNPLAAVRVHSFPGDYYENQRFLTRKIDMASAGVCLLASLQVHTGADDAYHLFSSRLVNNFETLDIDHYLVLYPALRGSKLAGDCIPFRAERETLVDISELAVDIDPRQWRSRRAIAARVMQAVTVAQKGFFAHSLRASEEPLARVYRKLALSLRYFRRSYRRDPVGGMLEVNLATAFETLLTDQYDRGVTDRLKRRVRLAMPSKRRTDAAKTIEALYEARSLFVHHGSTKKFNMRPAQELFARLFVRLTERLASWTPTKKQPMADLLGDK